MIIYWDCRVYKPLKVPLWVLLLIFFLLLIPILNLTAFIWIITFIIMDFKDGNLIWKKGCIIDKIVNFLNKKY